MSNKVKWNKTWISGVVTCLLLGLGGLPVAQAQEKSIDEYLDDARPYLHHSCESAWAATGENGDEYIAIINRFVAVIFINHDFDVKQIEEAPKADQERLQVTFYNEVGRICTENPQTLLAGVVEQSLVNAFAEVQKKDS